MANTYTVSLVVISEKLSLSELASRLGREPQSGSHERGTPRGLPGSGKRWPHSLWRQNARDADASWQDQCGQMLRDMPPKYAEVLADEPNHVSMLLSIAAFEEAAYFNIHLPRTLIAEVSAKGIDVEITAYPCRSAQPQGPQGEGHT